MKYFAALTLAAAATGIQLASGAGISCVQCLDGDGRRAECTGSNESEGECGEHVIGCMEEIRELKKQQLGCSSTYYFIIKKIFFQSLTRRATKQ